MPTLGIGAGVGLRLAQQRIEDEILVRLWFGGGVFAGVCGFGRLRGLAVGLSSCWRFERPAHAYLSPVILSRAALARKAERVRPRSLAAVSIASSRPASMEILARTGRALSSNSGM